MGNYVEGKYATPTTSPAIARLVRAYGHYIKDCISYLEKIDDVYTFYKRMVRIKEMNKSRVYERYLINLSRKQSLEKDND